MGRAFRERGGAIVRGIVARCVSTLAGLGRRRIRFDLTAMGWPFDPRFHLRQPYLENEVAELEQRNPNRRWLIEWLRGVRLRLPPQVLDEVIDDVMTLSVPCGLFELV